MNTTERDLPIEQERVSILRMSGWREQSSAKQGLFLLGGTLMIFYLLFRRIDLAQVFSLLSLLPWHIWILAGVLTLSFPLLSAIRWKTILRTMGHDIPFSRATLTIAGVWPLSAVSPSKSGDLLKAYSLRAELKPMVVAGSVLTERALDVMVLSVLALLGGIYFRDYRIFSVALTVLIALMAGFVFVRLNVSLPIGHKMQNQLRDLFLSFRALWGNPRVTLLILFFTVANWLASIGQTYLLFRGVGADVSLGFTAAALPIAIFAGLLPISIGGMGTRDTAMVLLFASYASETQSLAVGLLYSFFGYWLLAILGLPLMRRALGATT